MRLKIMLFIFVLFSVALSASEIKARVGIFLPEDKLFRNIYGSVGPTFELEETVSFGSPLSAWWNLNFTPMNGHSIGLEDPTRIFIANFSFGGQVSHIIRHVKGYVGLGCVLSGVSINNKNSACCRDSSQFGAGGVLKLGLQRNWSGLFLEYFADFYYQPTHFESRRNIGGLRTGVGLGYIF